MPVSGERMKRLLAESLISATIQPFPVRFRGVSTVPVKRKPSRVTCELAIEASNGSLFEETNQSRKTLMPPLEAPPGMISLATIRTAVDRDSGLGMRLTQIRASRLTACPPIVPVICAFCTRASAGPDPDPWPRACVVQPAASTPSSAARTAPVPRSLIRA
jgi:hypothetical protein